VWDPLKFGSLQLSEESGRESMNFFHSNFALVFNNCCYVFQTLFYYQNNTVLRLKKIEVVEVTSSERGCSGGRCYFTLHCEKINQFLICCVKFKINNLYKAGLKKSFVQDAILEARASAILFWKS